MIACLVILTALVPVACGGSDAAKTPNTTPVAETAPPLPQPRPIPPPPGRPPAVPATEPVDDRLQYELERILAAYSDEQHFRLIEHLAADRFQGRKTGSAGSRAAGDFIAAEFSRLGLRPWQQLGLTSYRQRFSFESYTDDNIIGVIPGSDPGGGFVIIGAHYDHLGLDDSGNAFNGADDNAAGVAAVLEAASIVRQLGYTPANTLVFCAFSGEEQGQHGSRALGGLIADAGLGGNTEMINIDGIGAAGGGYFGVWDQGFDGAAPLVETINQAGEYLGVTVISEGTDIGSDSQPFNWEFAIPAVTVDWDWGSDPSAYHPNYHTIYDDAAAIDRPTLARATRVILVAMWLRASVDQQQR